MSEQSRYRPHKPRITPTEAGIAETRERCVRWLTGSCHGRIECVCVPPAAPEPKDGKS